MNFRPHFSCIYKVETCQLERQTRMQFIKTIAVQGSVGAGKSTFIEYVESQKNDQVQCIYEPVNRWTDIGGENLLKLFYQNPSKYAFALQSYIQLTMIEAHRTKPRDDSVKFKFMERSIHTSINVFIKQQSQSGILDNIETKILNEWYEFLLKEHKELAVDLVIYLKATPENCLQRIRKRGRKGEENISIDYLNELHTLHEDWLNSKFDTIVLNTDRGQDDQALKLEYDLVLNRILS